MRSSGRATRSDPAREEEPRHERVPKDRRCPDRDRLLHRHRDERKRKHVSECEEHVVVHLQRPERAGVSPCNEREPAGDHRHEEAETGEDDVGRAFGERRLVGGGLALATLLLVVLLVLVLWVGVVSLLIGLVTVRRLRRVLASLRTVSLARCRLHTKVISVAEQNIQLLIEGKNMIIIHIEINKLCE